jgi:BirA family biotin operon repressor/biotin-[acetyl-CoA-carboxylase] ligase
MKELFFESIDSTSTYAKLHVKELDSDEITCIHADEQTSGRGRFNRPWASPKGVNIYATFCFQLSFTQMHLTSLSQVMSASITSVLLDNALSPTIKWPNDIRINQKKICGVLSELLFQGEVVFALIGVGLNVNMEEADFKPIDQAATSLKIATGHTWDKRGLLKQLQRQFESDLTQFKTRGFAPFHSFYERFLYPPGEQIRTFDGKKEWVGTYHSLNENGGLNILLPNKTIQTIYSASK